MIDTHAHLNFKAYEKDAGEVIKRTLAQGVSIINVGSKYNTSKKALELAEKYNNVYAAVGLHPMHSTPDFMKKRIDKEEGGFLTEGEIFNKENYKKLAESKKVVAIGEIGLDYYYKPKTKKRLELFKEKQKEVFIEQLNLAKELGLPAIFHCRMAHKDLISILEKYKTEGVIHCFTGNVEELEKYLEMGFYIGLNGIIFKLDLKRVIKKIPIDRILIETDCPYLTPIQKEGIRNEPLFIKYIIEKIAEIKGVTFEEIARESFSNAKKLFRI